MKCLKCKKTIKGMGVHFYGKEACLDCYQEYQNNKKIINKPKLGESVYFKVNSETK